MIFMKERMNNNKLKINKIKQKKYNKLKRQNKYLMNQIKQKKHSDQNQQKDQIHKENKILKVIFIPQFINSTNLTKSNIFEIKCINIFVSNYSYKYVAVY